MNSDVKSLSAILRNLLSVSLEELKEDAAKGGGISVLVTSQSNTGECEFHSLRKSL